MAVAMSESSLGVGNKPLSKELKLGGPLLKQPSFEWGVSEKYTELRYLRLKENNIFKTCNVNDTEKYQLSETG